MKLKINKACDLSSISVLPPQSRRLNAVSGGSESSTIFGRSQTAVSQLRPQQSQLSLSQGVSSQHGLLSQFSQNSQDEILTNEKIGSQERENSVRRSSCLPRLSYTREENQMMVSRTSSNMMRKWSGQENKCQISEELEHRIGIIETSLSRHGMILDSVQSDVIQVNKGTKEVVLEMEGMRQKLVVHDDSLQLLNKGQEDMKVRLDVGLRSLSDQLKQNMNQENLTQILSTLSSLSEKIDSQVVKLQSDLRKDVSKEIQVLASSIENYKLKQANQAKHEHKAASFRAPPQDVRISNKETGPCQAQQANPVLKVETGGWTLVKQKRATSKFGSVQRSNQITSSKQPERVVIESDEEIDGGFSCLLNETGADDYSIEKTEEETARILRRARRRKRKYCNTIIIN